MQLGNEIPVCLHWQGTLKVWSLRLTQNGNAKFARLGTTHTLQS
jgi:hypothetical protein